MYLVLNRVSGQCTSIVPPTAGKIEGISNISQLEEQDFIKRLSHDLSLETLSVIPCYRDTSFSEKEFLTVLRYPYHPFSKEIERLASA